MNEEAMLYADKLAESCEQYQEPSIDPDEELKFWIKEYMELTKEIL